MILENMNKKILYIIFACILLAGCTEAKRVNIGEHYCDPNTFTPNGDGLNESFNPMTRYGILFNSYHIIIFDESLQTMFESDDINESWSPGINHPNLPSGFYEYQITYNCSVDSVNYYDYITNAKVNLIR